MGPTAGATYFCVGTIAAKPQQGCGLPINLSARDIDFQAVIEDEPTIRYEDRRAALSADGDRVLGHGLHLYWLLRESLDAQQHLTASRRRCAAWPR